MPGVKFANAIFLVDREYRSFESFIVGTGLDDVVFEHRFDFGIDQFSMSTGYIVLIIST